MKRKKNHQGEIQKHELAMNRLLKLHNGCLGIHCTSFSTFLCLKFSIKKFKNS